MIRLEYQLLSFCCIRVHSISVKSDLACKMEKLKAQRQKVQRGSDRYSHRKEGRKEGGGGKGRKDKIHSQCNSISGREREIICEKK